MMLKTLVKKQMMELNRGFFYNQKTGKMRDKGSSILFIILYAFLIIGLLGGMFTLMSVAMCTALVEAGLAWLYFVIASMVAVFMGVFGSVFNTFSALYQAKDNDLLLSLPIPVSHILISRLIGVYLMGLMFSGVVMIPAAVVYWIFAPFSVMGIIGSFMLVLLISVLVLVLSCLLGWVVAKISNKLKNKGFITAIVSLVFFGAYYMFYFKASDLLQTLIANAATVGAKVKGAAYPLYLLGKAGTGAPLPLLIVTLVMAAALALTWYVLARSFIKIATTTGATSRTKYREKAARVQSGFAALLGKECKRFTASATYMLNCGMGILLMPIACVFFLIKGAAVRELVTMLELGEGFVGAILIAVICMLASMNDITAPSVSLEGKSIWIVQSLPVSAWQVLKAKLTLHVILTAIPVFLCSLCGVIVLRPTVWTALLIFLLPLLYVVFSACFGLFLNLQRPNLKWTSEIIPIKQSMSVMVALFGGWGYAIAIAVGCLLLRKIIPAEIILLAVAVLTVVLVWLLYRWLRKKGTAIFEAL